MSYSYDMHLLKMGDSFSHFWFEENEIVTLYFTLDFELSASRNIIFMKSVTKDSALISKSHYTTCELCATLESFCAGSIKYSFIGYLDVSKCRNGKRNLKTFKQKCFLLDHQFSYVNSNNYDDGERMRMMLMMIYNLITKSSFASSTKTYVELYTFPIRLWK